MRLNDLGIFPTRQCSLLLLAMVVSLCSGTVHTQQPKLAARAAPLYRQASAPIERRVDDLLGRMTLQEKVRQLDLYSGANTLVDKQKDSTHAAPDAVFMPEKRCV